MIIMNNCNVDVFYVEKLTQFKDIVNHYVKSWIFVCDIISLLPLEVLCLVWHSKFEREFAFGVLKLNRLLKIYRVCLCCYVLHVLLSFICLFYKIIHLFKIINSIWLWALWMCLYLLSWLPFVPNNFRFCYLNISMVLQLGWLCTLASFNNFSCI